MELRDVLYDMMQQNQRAAQLTDLRVGTVTGADPLEITVNTAMAPLRREVLYLTEPVIEKKIPVLSHTHEIDGLSHSHTVSGLGHAHNTGGLSHAHTVEGLGHSHTAEGGETGTALEGAYQSGSSLAGSYGSDTQLSGTYATAIALGSGVEAGQALGGVSCVENGKPLPVENGYIILNRGLAVGDRVLLLRVQGGQKFIVLSRVFEG